MKWGISKNRNTDPVKCFGGEVLNEHTAPPGGPLPCALIHASKIPVPPTQATGILPKEAAGDVAAAYNLNSIRGPCMSYLHLLGLVTAGKAPLTWSCFLRGLMLALAAPST
jgi:hypothetical protein